MASPIKQFGVTLFEVMLVILIGTSFLLMGVKLYQQFKAENDIAQVEQNINTLFLGLKGYYEANCIGNLNYTADQNLTTGDLDPRVAGTLPASIPINITTKLINNGFLPSTPLISPSIIAGYVLQFNVDTSTTKTVNFCYAGNCSSQPTKAVNNVYLLKAQVAVQLSNTSQIAYYKARLNADCISKLNGSIVTPCPGDPTGSYLVFQRLPSFAAPDTMSSLWWSMPIVKEFKQQYTNDDGYAVNVDDTSNTNTTRYQNYLCGG